MTRPTPTASTWRDRLENAVRRQVQAERYADSLTSRRLDPTDIYAEELRNGRRAAALAEAEAWSDYARRCCEAMDDAAVHEARRSRYDQGGAA